MPFTQQTDFNVKQLTQNQPTTLYSTRSQATPVREEVVLCVVGFYPRDANASAVFATATCLSVSPDVCPSHAGIVPSRKKQDREMYTV